MRTQILTLLGTLSMLSALAQDSNTTTTDQQTMKITRKSFDKDLRKYIGFGRMWARMVSKESGVKRVKRWVDKPSRGKNLKGMHCEEVYIPSTHGGDSIRVRIFKPLNCEGDLPGMLYVHGGGYMMGTPELYYVDALKRLLETRPCVIVAPDYRKSTTHPFPAGFNDCYDALLWMQKASAELGVKQGQYFIGGYSAGGGMTAALTLKARDTKDIVLAFHMPFYPMLDYRQNTPSAQIMGKKVPSWNARNSAFAWKLYLAQLQADSAEIPVYASPALNEDFSGLPPAITFVGSMDPFRDETIAYVNALKENGIPVDFELFEGCFHGFEATAKKTKIAQRANDFQFDAYARFYDKYIDLQAD